jgi:hypothetical protein
VTTAGTYYLIADAYATGGGGPFTLDYTITCGGVPDGACCFADGSCQVLTSAECSSQGGSYQGNDTDCDPNPCEVVPTQSTTWGQIKSLYR